MDHHRLRLSHTRPGRAVAPRRVSRLRVIGPEDGRRQMNRGRRDAVHFFEYAREEAERVSDEDGAARLDEAS